MLTNKESFKWLEIRSLFGRKETVVIPDRTSCRLLPDTLADQGFYDDPYAAL
jgi:hypothetical protein